ncbi:MAG: cell division protein FtsZ [Clostridia bacterium]
MAIDNEFYSFTNVNDVSNNKKEDTTDFEEEQDSSGSIVNIKIFGVGGGGCNAINRLVKANIYDGVEYIAANTDMMALNSIINGDVKRIQLGKILTSGLGAGSKPEVGENAAEESEKVIKKAIQGANLLFITAGMGGGTGTGGAPVVAKIARELNILTIAVVTKPFLYEGTKKMAIAELGIEKLREYVDVIVVVPNEKACKLAKPNTPLVEVFKLADDVLHRSIIGITEIVIRPSQINLDFADIETVIKNMGTAHIGIGEAKGENRVMRALQKATVPYLIDSTIEGATQIIVSVIADLNVGALEVQDALNMITDVTSPDANIISGIGFDSELKDEVKITIIATGFNESQKPNAAPKKKMPIIETNNKENNPFSVDNEEDDKIPDFEPKNSMIQTENNHYNENEVQQKEINDNQVPGFLQRIKNLRKN